MQIKLKWVNNNDVSAVVEVFRDTAPINTASPGAALATLPGNATTYTDAAVLAGVTYYYAVAVSRNGKKVFTPVKTFTNELRRGPGGSRILFGDDRLGYMGKVSQLDFIEIGRVMNLTTDQTANYQFTWHKFIRKGKILFLPERPVCHTTNSYKVYGSAVRENMGLVSGLTWNFNNSTWSDANKTRIVERLGDRFHFRAPRGLPDDWDGTAPTAGMVANPETEFNELIQTLLLNEVYFPSKIGCVRAGVTNVAGHMAPIVCAERVGTAGLIRRMNVAPVTGTALWAHAGTVNRTKDDFLSYTTKAAATGADPTTYNAVSWDAVWPVLELVE